MKNEESSGGVTAPAGFTAGGFRCGFKSSRAANDTALIVSRVPCTAAAVFTENLVKAEPVKLSAQHVAGGKAQAVIANAGNANACTGAQGRKNALRMARAVAGALSVPEEEVLVCSTGVIGQQFPETALETLEKNAAGFCAALSREGHTAAREAILTTDTVYKESEIRFELDGRTVTIGAMAKGSGMIHINMGTMLAFVTTDCAISAEMLDCALRESAVCTYNCVSVDGDTSTNDTLLILANGLAGNTPVTEKNEAYGKFLQALTELNTVMARKIAADGEGATRLVECLVTGAASGEAARTLAKSVVSSNLVKAAFYGRDANWGRILCALGYSGVPFSPESVRVSFRSAAGEIAVCENGMPLPFDEQKASSVLDRPEVLVLVDLGGGNGTGRAWGCDLTCEYVRINGDYRS